MIWYTSIYSYILFDELRNYTVIQSHLRSLKWGAKWSEYCCSHSSHIQFKMLLVYHCDTQKPWSREIAKFLRKQLNQSPFFSKVADSSALNNRFFPKQFFTPIPEIIGTFQERLIHVWLSNHEAKACWWVQQQDETVITLTKYLCKWEH